MRILSENELLQLIEKECFENEEEKLRVISILFQNDSDLSMKLHVDHESIFYSQYFWYLKFQAEFMRNHGYDAGIEQGQFKLLESISNFIDLNWDVIEKITNNELHENDAF